MSESLEGKTIITLEDGRKLEFEGELVKPDKFYCRNIPFWNNVMGVKINYSCGKCGFSQSTRVPLQDYPITACSYCNTRNIFPLGISKD